LSAELALDLPNDRVAVQRVRRRRQPKAPGAFLTIGEVADQLQLEQHVLRFWESKFEQISPVKRAGSRRYYRPEDVSLIQRIQKLLYQDGYTIRGVQQLLDSENGKQTALDENLNLDSSAKLVALSHAVQNTLSATQDLLGNKTELAPNDVNLTANDQNMTQISKQQLSDLMDQLLQIRQLVDQQ
jgi:DNA-binding transcriptional MerR regulator